LPFILSIIIWAETTKGGRDAVVPEIAPEINRKKDISEGSLAQTRRIDRDRGIADISSIGIVMRNSRNRGISNENKNQFRRKPSSRNYLLGNLQAYFCNSTTPESNALITKRRQPQFPRASRVSSSHRRLENLCFQRRRSHA
jgi:hypothetical protein